jgi:hypothetical protein
MKRIVNVSVLIVSFLLIYSCKKTLEPVESASQINHNDSLSTPLSEIPFPVNPFYNCDYKPDYGDSVLFVKKGNPGDQYAYPANNNNLKGTFLSWPDGLDLDAHTGAINLTNSQTGQRFSIGFIPEHSTDTCISHLVIGGASYMDSIYLLSASHKSALPYFNANSNTPNPCASGTGCLFDYTYSARLQGIVIDPKMGFIDLEKTMAHNPFGLLPKDGATILTTIHYQLNDQSNGTPERIQIKLIYYYSRSNIPGSIISLIQKRVSGITSDNGDGVPTKPPIIIITRTK